MNGRKYMANIKYGTVDVPDENFKDENITAHISIRLPLSLVKALKKHALTEEYEGRYQTLICNILSSWVEHQTPKKKRA